jgi:hypothetical protein
MSYQRDVDQRTTNINKFQATKCKIICIISDITCTFKFGVVMLTIRYWAGVEIIIYFYLFLAGSVCSTPIAPLRNYKSPFAFIGFFKLWLREVDKAIITPF